MEFNDCGNMLLFLWMEKLLTDAEYYRAIDRFNKRIAEERQSKTRP